MYYINIYSISSKQRSVQQSSLQVIIPLYNATAKKKINKIKLCTKQKSKDYIF